MPRKGRTLMRLTAVAILAVICLPVWNRSVPAREDAKLTPLQQDLVRSLDSLQPELVRINQDIWGYAELGLQEFRSAARLIGALRSAGFRIREGVSNMPTAFVGEYGS